MAFSLRDLSVLAYANGFTLWHYRGRGDTIDEVQRPGYLEPARDMLASGDMVMVSATDGARVLCIARAHHALTAVPLA